MATGIVSGPWGYSPKQISGILNTAEFNGNPLTYQLGLNSRPPTFGTNGEMISPMTVSNKNYYNNFGKSKRKVSEINYLKKYLKKK